MRILNIEYPMYFDSMDKKGRNFDIFVKMEDGVTYTLVITTPDCYYLYSDWYADVEEGLVCNRAHYPEIIVKALTREIINKAIETYVADKGYWLKAYFLAGMEREGVFSIDEMNRIIKDINKTKFSLETNILKTNCLQVIDIEYPLYYEYTDKDNGCMIILVKTSDGMTYKLTIVTPNYYYQYMDKERLDYIPASPPHIIVKSLRRDSIRKTIENYIEGNGYYLKLYFIAQNGRFDIRKMDKKINEIKEDQRNFDDDDGG